MDLIGISQLIWYMSQTLDQKAFSSFLGVKRAATPRMAQTFRPSGGMLQYSILVQRDCTINPLKEIFQKVRRLPTFPIRIKYVPLEGLTRLYEFLTCKS